jgi:hypothetical protein
VGRNNTVQYSTAHHNTTQAGVGQNRTFFILETKNVDKSKEKKIESPQYRRKTGQKKWNENSIERINKILLREQKNESNK